MLRNFHLQVCCLDYTVPLLWQFKLLWILREVIRKDYSHHLAGQWQQNCQSLGTGNIQDYKSDVLHRYHSSSLPKIQQSSSVSAFIKKVLFLPLVKPRAGVKRCTL